VTEPASLERVLWSSDDPDVRAVRAAFIAGVNRVAPELLAPALLVLEKFARPNWTMEWYLPRWIGEVLSAPPLVWQPLMLSNLYGLAYVKLRDDLVDGEANAQDEALLALSTAFHTLWTYEYRAQFGADPAFWEYYERYLAQWSAATLENDRDGAAHPSPLSAEGRLQLAHRGAPLKICCTGAAILMGRSDIIADMEAAVDHLLVAAVLLDHAGDWVEDLSDGRYNAFVAYASGLPQSAANLEQNRQRVREELYLGAAAHPYYAVVREELHVADDIARALGCRDLHDFLAWLDAETMRIEARLAAEVTDHLSKAAAALFGVEVNAPIPVD
jgi:hypothetical protein